MHHSVGENLLVCPNQEFALDSAKEHRISKQQHWSQRQHCLQCPCTVCQHLQHIFYHDLYLHFYLYTVKEKQPMDTDALIKTAIIQRRESKKRKSFKYIQNHRIEFWPPSPFILIFGIWNLKVLHLLLLHCCYCSQQNNSDSIC